MTQEPMQPLKFQTNSENDSFMIYSRSTAIFRQVDEKGQTEFFELLQDVTGMRDALEKKFFMGTITADGELVIGEETTVEDW